MVIKKNNLCKYLCSVGDGEIVEFDVVEGEKGVEVVNVIGLDGVFVEGSCYVVDWCWYRCGYYGRCCGFFCNVGEIGEMKDGVFEGIQFQVYWNLIYCLRFCRGFVCL